MAQPSAESSYNDNAKEMMKEALTHLFTPHQEKTDALRELVSSGAKDSDGTEKEDFLAAEDLEHELNRNRFLPNSDRDFNEENIELKSKLKKKNKKNQNCSSPDSIEELDKVLSGGDGFSSLLQEPEENYEYADYDDDENSRGIDNDFVKVCKASNITTIVKKRSKKHHGDDIIQDDKPKTRGPNASQCVAVQIGILPYGGKAGWCCICYRKLKQCPSCGIFVDYKNFDRHFKPPQNIMGKCVKPATRKKKVANATFVDYFMCDLFPSVVDT